MNSQPLFQQQYSQGFQSQDYEENPIMSMIQRNSTINKFADEEMTMEAPGIDEITPALQKLQISNIEEALIEREFRMPEVAPPSEIIVPEIRDNLRPSVETGEKKGRGRPRGSKKSGRPKQDQNLKKMDHIINEGDSSNALSLIEQISTLNINDKSKRKRAHQLNTEGCRRNPTRESSSKERMRCSMNIMSQNSFNCSQQIIEKKRATERMSIEEQSVFDPNNPYEKIIISSNLVDEDIQCDICLDMEYEDDDLIVLCDLCNAATHQQCYGGQLAKGIPQGNWYCDRCQILVQDKAKKCDEIKCFLCDDIDGMMKCIDQASNLWAHVICVNWNPDIYFTDDTKSRVEGTLNKKRFDLWCNLCLKRKGACIQCDYMQCARSYHVRCAVRRDVIKNWEEMEDVMQNAEDDWYIPIFCSRHEDVGIKEFKEKGKLKLDGRGRPNKKPGAAPKTKKKFSEKDAVVIKSSVRYDLIKTALQILAEQKKKPVGFEENQRKDIQDRKQLKKKKIMRKFKKVAQKVAKKVTQKIVQMATRSTQPKTKVISKGIVPKKVLGKHHLQPKKTVVQNPNLPQIPFGAPAVHGGEMFNSMLGMFNQFMQNMVVGPQFQQPYGFQPPQFPQFQNLQRQVPIVPQTVQQKNPVGRPRKTGV